MRHLSRDLAPRDEGHPEGLARAAAWLHERFAKTGASVVDQPFTVDGQTFVNVVASYGPASGARVVVGAHYDSAGPRPGADDNASGVAVLLALAERLGAAPPAARVDLVAWTLEEPPSFATDHMGSVIHARALADARVEVRAVIALETLGYYADTPGSQTYPDPAMAQRFGDRGDFLAVVGRPEDAALIARLEPAFDGHLRAEALAAPASVTGVAFSDHRSYWPFAMSAVMLTDTAFYRNKRYHTDDDTPDTLDYDRMAQVAAGLERGVRALSEVPP
ncbi:MAG: M28 family peptidase [Myxococcota bacterium]